MKDYWGHVKALKVGLVVEYSGPQNGYALSVPVGTALKIVSKLPTGRLLCKGKAFQGLVWPELVRLTDQLEPCR